MRTRGKNRKRNTENIFFLYNIFDDVCEQCLSRNQLLLDNWSLIECVVIVKKRKERHIEMINMLCI